jgi:two-component system, cell cycle sensor histidine kinase and response regulator CckA
LSKRHFPQHPPQTDALLAAIVASSEDPIIGTDLDGIVTSWNHAAERMYGFSAAEMVGGPLGRLIRSDRLQQELEIVARIKLGERVGRLETVRIAKDGGEVCVAVTISPTRDAAGQVIGVSEIARENSGRLVARQTLEQQEKQYRTLFETCPNPTWVYDAESLAFLAVNDAAVRQYGYSREEFLRMTIKDIRPPEDIPALLESRAVSSSEPRAEGPCRHRKKNGEIIQVGIQASAIQFEGRFAQRVIAFDVTAQYKAEQAIRQSEERLRALVTSMEDVALEFDQDGTYLAIWTTRDDLLSHSRSELLGRTIAAVHGEAIGELFVGSFRRVAESRSVETINYTMNVVGGPRDFVGRISPIVNPDGTCERVCVLCRDVTEQKKLEAQFLRAQRMESIGTLASGVAHDLNNILAPILVGAAVLRRSGLSAGDEKLLSTIETCAQRGADIVKQVLTFARGAEGARLLLQPAHLVSDLAKIAAQTFPKTITVRPRYAEGLWLIEGDPTLLHQVLLNLSVNARDAMPAGGTLTLSAENFPVDEHYASMTPGANAGPHVLFEVTDTGLGIPRQIIDKIFDPFFTTKEVGKGTGLGLSTVIGIVKSHGGFVAVYSEVGHGTSFRVFLPASKTEMPDGIIAEPEVLPRANGELLLIVDDEEPILEVARALLQGHGYEVLTATEATEALALFAVRKDEIKVVVTDLAMPLLDGLALIRTLRKMKADVRVIASTGRGGREDHAHELADLNVQACLSKPYNKEKLLTTLRDVLKEPKG